MRITVCSTIFFFFAGSMGTLSSCSSPDTSSGVPEPPEVIAHRGASAVAPENTIPAVEAAWEKGADAVEVDVRISADDRLVLIHDASTERTSGRDLEVARTSYDSLKKLDAGSWFDPEFEGTRIPTLDSVMDHIPADKELIIEFKSGPESIELLSDLLANREFIPAFSIISFDRELLLKAKERFPKIPAYWVISGVYDLGSILQKVDEGGLDGLNLHEANFGTGERIERIREEGLKVLTWTVNDPERARRLTQQGVQGIVTDRPGRIEQAFLSLDQVNQ